MVDYPNGRIPPSMLRQVSNFRPLYTGVSSNVGSDLLRSDAWAALNMLQAAFFKQFGRALNVSEAYRGLTRQTAVWQQYLGGGPLAAPVGTSNHGWALAVDFGSGVATYGSAAKVWMDANAPRFGWHPTGNSFSKREAWHFDFVPNSATENIPASGGAYTPIENDPEEEDMNEAQNKMLVDIHNAIYSNNNGIFPQVNVAADNAKASYEEGQALRGKLDQLIDIVAVVPDEATGIAGGIRGLIRDIRLNAYTASAKSSNLERIFTQDVEGGKPEGLRGLIRRIVTATKA